MMNIKKLVLIALIACMSVAVFAQTTDSANITLSGEVVSRVEISIAAESGIDSFDLASDVTDFKIATVTEFCNISGGYDLTITTAAGDSPAFVGASASLAYTVEYGNSPVTFTSGSALVVDDAPRTDYDGNDKDLTISYAGATAGLPAGTGYTDTLTFTITAN